MTVCPTGSAPKPTSPSFIRVTAEQYGSLMPPGLAWIQPFLQYLPPFELDVSDFCALEPPALPAIDAFDAIALLTPTKVTLWSIAAQKFIQLVQAYAWYQLCQCNSGGTGAPPAGYAAPPDLPAINPPQIVTPPLVVPCATYVVDPVVISGHAAATIVLTSRPLPPGVTYVRWVINVVGAPDNTKGTNWYVQFPDAFGVLQPALGVVAYPNGIVSNDFVVSGAPVRFGIQATPGNEPPAYTYVQSSRLDFYCGVRPGQLQTTCCAPDPGLLAKIDQVVAMVTLIQRQAVPFGYVPNAIVHAGLVGSGEFAVQGLIALQVEITTLPGYLGLAAGDPQTVFDAGWVTCGTADGWGKSVRLDHASRLIVPEAMGMTTRVGYTLPPGVVVKITELVREP